VDPHLADRGLKERGVTSVQFLLAGALSLVLFLIFANVIVVQYGRGAFRSALDQGARVGAVTGALTGCEMRVEAVLDQILGGAMGDSVQIECEVFGDLVVAHGSAVFPSWTPFTSDFVIDLRAQATLEPNRD
jgi:hypothetical protein